MCSRPLQSLSRSYQCLEVTDRQPTIIVKGAFALNSGLSSAFASTEQDDQPQPDRARKFIIKSLMTARTTHALSGRATACVTPSSFFLSTDVMVRASSTDVDTSSHCQVLMS